VPKKFFGVQHLFDAMTNPKVIGAVLVTNDDENNRDRQVMVSHDPSATATASEDETNVKSHYPRPGVPNIAAVSGLAA